jgi:hypothetical protein
MDCRREAGNEVWGELDDWGELGQISLKWNPSLSFPLTPHSPSKTGVDALVDAGAQTLLRHKGLV